MGEPIGQVKDWLEVAEIQGQLMDFLRLLSWYNT